MTLLFIGILIIIILMAVFVYLYDKDIAIALLLSLFIGVLCIVIGLSGIYRQKQKQISDQHEKQIRSAYEMGIHNCMLDWKQKQVDMRNRNIKR